MTYTKNANKNLRQIDITMENRDQSVLNLGLKCPLCIVPNINIGPSALKQHMELFHQVNPSGIPFYHLNHSIQETANRALLIEKNAREEAIQTISNELYNVKLENSNYSTQLKNIQSEVKLKNEEILKSQIKGLVYFELLCVKLYSRVLKMAAGPPKFSWMIFLAFRFIWRKKFFFRHPPGGAALLGGGGKSAFWWVNDVVSKQNFS